MDNRKNGTIPAFSIADAARAQATTYLAEAYASAGGLLGDLNPWTQRLITVENMAKLALVFETDEPAEACYRDLIREIDTEAKFGVYLARHGSVSPHLAHVINTPGVTGQLYHNIDIIAPIVFPDELAHSADDMDLVWVTIEAFHDRSHVDAAVSEIIMRHLLDDAEAALDMSNAIRAMYYAFHEDSVRRRCGLPSVLDDRRGHDLAVAIRELTERCGSYDARTEQIRRRADVEIRRSLA